LFTDIFNRHHFHEWLDQGAILSYDCDSVLIGWGKSSWCDFSTSDQEILFYFPDYFLEGSHPCLSFECVALLKRDELLSFFENSQEQHLNRMNWESPSKQQFSQAFYNLKNEFRKTDLEKAVLYTFMTASGAFSISQRRQSLRSMLQYARDLPVFLYGYWIEKEGMLGATPELLFRCRHSETPILETMALAGTQKTGAESHEMNRDSKLLHEHEIVVKDLVSQLTRYGVVQLGDLQILSLPVVSHLYTPICVQLSSPDQNFEVLVHQLHPTPALGGFPRETAKEWLKGYAKRVPRGRFGAPVGYWHQAHQSACYVGIRNVTWNHHQLAIGAGCGIVEESFLEVEWDEILLKTRAIQNILKI
jgi:menaquinone-specific isochorismate synthase